MGALQPNCNLALHPTAAALRDTWAWIGYGVALAAGLAAVIGFVSWILQQRRRPEVAFLWRIATVQLTNAGAVGQRGRRREEATARVARGRERCSTRCAYPSKCTGSPTMLTDQVVRSVGVVPTT